MRATVFCVRSRLNSPCCLRDSYVAAVALSFGWIAPCAPPLTMSTQTQVQQVAWHPNGLVLATACTDFKCRVVSAVVEEVRVPGPKSFLSHRVLFFFCRWRRGSLSTRAKSSFGRFVTRTSVFVLCRVSVIEDHVQAG